MRKFHPWPFLVVVFLLIGNIEKAKCQVWEVFDKQLNLEKKISNGDIQLLGNSIRINNWENDLLFLGPDYESFATVDSSSLYQYLEPWIIIKNENKFGAFHEYGEQVMPTVYDEIATYYNLLLARKGNAYFVYDRGKRTTQPIGTFAMARFAKNGQVIAKREDGSFALPLSENPDHRYISLSDPCLDVIIAEENSGLGLINREGDYILKPIIDEIRHLEENYFFARNEAEYLLINALSTDADIRYNSFHKISLEHDVLVEYIHGRLRRIMKNDGILLDIVGMDSVRKVGQHYNVHFKNQKTGLLNPQGKWEVRPTLSAQRIFPGSEGLFGALMGEKFGYINTSGDTIIDPVFDQVKPFSEGFAEVKKGQQWGYVNPNNEMRIPFSFEKAGPFSNGVAIVVKDGRFNLINQQGEMLLENSCEQISKTGTGYFLLENEGLMGMAKPDGQLISPAVYEEIRREGPDQVLVRKGDAYGIIKENGDFILPLHYSKILFDKENDRILAKSKGSVKAASEEIAAEHSQGQKKKKNKGA
ncbi:WG repeat-containing protein [Cyclobacterium plantarum]|uniref:WG repeat-containing protein n=1 Tax=Cyclobacterium plantarum TaxID=2716263 RepID=A0ABX0HBV9_9BACT|nr:WG repeat-containing protein [Cyclobacterium plantarum]NHE57652.1 WG repeat-containing protein [Cyclobacterium plantarum]